MLIESRILPGMKQLYDDGYISIYVDGQESLLYYKIVGYPKFSDIIHHGHDLLFEIMHKKKENAPVHLIADLLEAKILLTRDIKFIAKTSYPRLAKAGIKNLAILLPDDLHVKLNVQKTIEYLGTGIFEHLQLFPSPEEAFIWFRSIKPQK
jgi:hypothetical protein